MCGLDEVGAAETLKFQRGAEERAAERAAEGGVQSDGAAPAHVLAGHECGGFAKLSARPGGLEVDGDLRHG